MRRLPLPRTLFGRLVLLLLAGLLLTQGLAGALSSAERSRALYRVLVVDGGERIAAAVELLDGMDEAERERLLTALDLPPLHVTLGLPWSELPADASAAAQALVEDLRARFADERPVTVSFAGPRRGPASFFVQVGLRDGSVASFLHVLPGEFGHRPTRLLVQLALTGLAAVLLAAAAVRWLTRPLARLASAAVELGGDLDRPPLAETGTTEVRAAARAFNAMQARLKRQLEDRARLLAAVSHDLKTPITRLRLRAELLPDAEARSRFTADLDDMEAMVQATLDYMRGADSTEAVAAIDVDALLEALADDAREAGFEVIVRGAAHAPYRGRPLALKRCLQNLLDNALAYGGGAPVALELDDGPARLRIRVLDRGPGIPEAELERVFEPFVRLEASRSRHTGGTGLGLGIARNLARAHGGELVLRRRDGGGLKAELTLPR